MLGQLENAGGRVVVADLEAGTGTLSRMAEGALDLALLVTEPSAKSIEVARRAVQTLAERRIGPHLVVANRLRDPGDIDLIVEGLGEPVQHRVPEDPDVARAERDGRAVIDVSPGAEAVAAVRALAAAVASRRPVSP